MFAFYNGVAALAAFLLPVLAKRIGNARTHMLCLLAGAAGYAAMLIIRNKYGLLLPMLGIGVAWASILAMPYVILTNVLPQRKFGVYIGIFNFFIVLPQLMVAAIMGGIIRSFFPTEPVWTMLVAALVMVPQHSQCCVCAKTVLPKPIQPEELLCAKFWACLAAAALLASCSESVAMTGRRSPMPLLQNAEWTRDAVLYQINTRQFTPEGTFEAAQKQLPRLKALGSRHRLADADPSDRRKEPQRQRSARPIR